MGHDGDCGCVVLFGGVEWYVAVFLFPLSPTPLSLVISDSCRVVWPLLIRDESGDAVTDKEGNKWDGANSGAYLFHYVKEGDGIKLKSTRIFADSSPALKLMLQKGLLDAETLKGIVIGS